MNYQKAYLYLFNQITDLTEQLKAIQCQAEEICITAEAPEDEIHTSNVPEKNETR